MTCYIDLPNPHDIHGPWINVFVGDREEALVFIKEKFGADDEGNINILSEDEDA
jgi:hypothetical protein